MRDRTRSGTWVRRGNTITLLGLDRDAEGAIGLEVLELETSHPTVRRGSSGTAVRDLQSRLLALGVNPGPIVDGIFGSMTDAAVKSFQRSRGLSVDGIVGPQTWRALDSAGTPRVTPSPPAPYVPPTIPGVRPELENILAAMRRKGYVIVTQPYKLNIVGVRAATAEPNRFDDSISVFFKDNGGKWTFKSNPATTDPGTYYLLNPMNPAGTAIVAPGQYPDSHMIGKHRGQYTALTQQGPITIIRDVDKDDRLDFSSGNRVTGVFGINIHRASATGTSAIVDRFSAGCQVFASSGDFAQFIDWCQRHADMYGNKFTYTLLDEVDL